MVLILYDHYFGITDNFTRNMLKKHIVSFLAFFSPLCIHIIITPMSYHLPVGPMDNPSMVGRGKKRASFEKTVTL